MNQILKPFILGILTLFVLVSCGDDEDTEVSNLSNDETAEQVSSVVSSDVVGIASHVDLLVTNAESKSNGRVAGLQCDVAYDTTLIYGYAGPNVTLDYSANYSFSLDCNNFNIPQSILIDLSTDGSYEGPRIMSSGSSDGQITADGLGIVVNEYTVNGSFDRLGQLIQKNRGQNAFNYETTVELANVTIDKTSRRITGGSALVTTTGTGTQGGSYQYSATVIFEGNGIATVEINGVQYQININTGEIIILG